LQGGISTGMCLVAAATTVTTAAVAGLNAVAVAAEAGDEQNPDNPLAASAVAVAAKDTIAVTAALVAATAAQKQDNPNPAAASTIVVPRICTSAVVSATTITQIAHINLLPPKVLFMLYSMQGGMSMFPKFLSTRYG